MTGFLTKTFNVILYQPLFITLILLYQFLPGNDFGIAVIVLTILIRLILFPLMNQSLKAQKALSKTQEKIQSIQNKYKDNKEKQMEAIIELYKQEKINPYASLVPLFIQIPQLIALYLVFWRELQPETLNLLYSFVPRPQTINPSFLGLLDLSLPSPALAILAGIFQFLQSKQLSSEKKTKDKISEVMSQQMLYFFPILTILILLRIPSAVALYWIITVLFSMVQQQFINKSTI